MKKGSVRLLLLTISVALSAISCSDHGTTPAVNVQKWNERVIRDYQFLDNTYYDLVRRDTVSEDDLMPLDSITNLELFFSVNINANWPGSENAKPCSLFVDPFRRDEYANETVTGKFLPYSPVYTGGGSYYYSLLEHYLIMDRPVTPDLSLGAYISFRRMGESTHRTIGNKPDGGPYVLKLIAHLNPQRQYVTWNYVWRNVYSLGGRIEDIDGLRIDIFLGYATISEERDPSDIDHQGASSFISILGLDNNNDGLVDTRNPQILDPVRGHLVFPARESFADSALNVKVNELYNTPSQHNRVDSSKYYIFIRYPRSP